jgi:hypothetical protein
MKGRRQVHLPLQLPYHSVLAFPGNKELMSESCAWTQHAYNVSCTLVEQPGKPTTASFTPLPHIEAQVTKRALTQILVIIGNKKRAGCPHTVREKMSKLMAETTNASQHHPSYVRDWCANSCANL